ncbi:hypothetical protein RBI65_17510 [Acinetobacter baumannii]|uniref:surface-adhesin E family protein n=1 Tax=Acinetobacter baumannii TaxID=470 RepID=UPI00192B0D9C|nr:surface-adhesin E family protein [Acinetobacter baumannii]EKU0206519.1 hypothetical protein [Acinetobacter baumannii]EKV6547397.1 hypothetical protein [Acinetobacter baumannii]ELB0409795.1 hypothetical protein [Acinetobacter baumannii]MDG6194853.1 hypothetical protein [Acinetobacter baumannii]MDK1585365.1 hypothetical protein [Acinetobacter baumannii]
MKIFIFIASVLFSSWAFPADNWLQITNTTKSIFSFDPDNIDNVTYQGKSYIKTWIREEELNQAKGQEGKLNGNKTMILYYFDCANKQLAIKSATKYRNGEPVKGNSINLNYLKFNDVIPGTVADAFLTHSCAGR